MQRSVGDMLRYARYGGEAKEGGWQERRFKFGLFYFELGILELLTSIIDPF